MSIRSGSYRKVGGGGHGLRHGSGLRGWLEEQECFYVLGVTGTHGVYHEGCKRQARTLAKGLPDEAWVQASAGKGSKGERLYD